MTHDWQLSNKLATSPCRSACSGSFDVFLYGIELSRGEAGVVKTFRWGLAAQLL
jgi:hypothetical protein